MASHLHNNNTEKVEGEAEEILTDKQIAICREFCMTAKLSEEERSHLMTIWLEAPSKERVIIARMYPQYFTDTVFVSRLTTRGCGRYRGHRGRAESTKQGVLAVKQGGGVVGRTKNGEEEEESSSDDGGHQSVARTLRAAVDEEICKLPGDGPHGVTLGLVCTEDLKQQVIELYQTQFQYPDRPKLEGLVQVTAGGTRTRTQRRGSFTWFVRSDSTKEIACVLTVIVHPLGTDVYFLEVPLCATALGYTKLGLARLLNAALQEHCTSIGGSCILVSAEPEAVPFWCNPSLGYVPLSLALKGKLEYHYANYCRKFVKSHLLTWEPPTMHNGVPVKDVLGGLSQWTVGGLGVLGPVDRALSRTPKIVLNGPSQLPTKPNPHEVRHLHD